MLGEFGLSGELQGAFMGDEGFLILALLVGRRALLIALYNSIETLRLHKGNRQEERKDNTVEA
jgi:hypothetical protein